MKKMQLVFLSVLVCGLAFTSNAQSVTKKQEGMSNWTIMVDCGDVSDLITGPFYFHMTEHWNPVTGEKEWYKFVFKSNEFKSLSTEEVFSVKFYKRSSVIPQEWDETFHFNAKGDQGSHYIGSLTWEWGMGITSINMRCL